MLVDGPETLGAQIDVLTKLANIGQLNIEAGVAKPDQAASAVVGDVQVHVPLAGLIDLDEEKARFQTELDEANGYAKNLEGRLGNDDYVKNAPDEVVQATRDELTKTQERARMIQEQINDL